MSELLSKFVLNPQTEQAVNGFLVSPAQALLITGAQGSGKSTLAQVIAAELLAVNSIDKLAKQSFYRHLKKPDDKRTIPIETVRAALNETRLLAPVAEGAVAARVIYIEDASKLGQDSQNVLLKDLEEPSKGTYFIITAESTRSVLPTIASRCQKLKIAPISEETALRFFNHDNKAKVRANWALSGGLVGLLTELLQHSGTHQLQEAADKAKGLIAADIYQKLLYVEGLSADREKLELYLQAQQKILLALYRSAVSRGDQGQAKAFLAKRRLILKLGVRLEANANQRLTATVLALEV